MRVIASRLLFGPNLGNAEAEREIILNAITELGDVRAKLEKAKVGLENALGLQSKVNPSISERAVAKVLKETLKQIEEE